MDAVGRVFGYTGAMGAVQGFAAGYFVWDLWVSIIHLDVLGVGSLAHAASALLITMFGFVSAPLFILILFPFPFPSHYPSFY